MDAREAGESVQPHTQSFVSLAFSSGFRAPSHCLHDYDSLVSEISAVRYLKDQLVDAKVRECCLVYS